MCIYTRMCIYIHMYYTYICIMYVCTHIHVYIYIYIMIGDEEVVAALAWLNIRHVPQLEFKHTLYKHNITNKCLMMCLMMTCFT